MKAAILVPLVVISIPAAVVFTLAAAILWLAWLLARWALTKPEPIYEAIKPYPVEMDRRGKG